MITANFENQRQAAIRRLRNWAIPAKLEFQFSETLVEENSYSEEEVYKLAAGLSSASLPDALRSTERLLNMARIEFNLERVPMAWFILVQIENVVSKVEHHLDEFYDTGKPSGRKITPLLKSKIVELIYQKSREKKWTSYSEMCRSIYDDMQNFHYLADYKGSQANPISIDMIKAWKHDNIVSEAFRFNSIDPIHPVWL